MCVWHAIIFEKIQRFLLHWSIIVYIIRASEEKGKKIMESVIRVYFASDCCGCEMTFAQADYGICPQCCEHCEVIGEEIVEDCGEY